jgi:lactaldehyde dehydrogenase/glycolaldehyde dehydrogenase
MFINGKFTDGKSKERIPVINPATEDVLDEVPRGTPEDSLAAVEAASAASQTGSVLPPTTGLPLCIRLLPNFATIMMKSSNF